jgi:HEAT repeat protein
LKDHDLAVQQCAALALRENPDPKTIPQLIILLGHKDRMLSRLCGDALIAVGKEATKEVLEVIENGSPTSRVEAARVLAAIEDPNSISSLFKLLDEESTLLRYWAEEGLNKMGVGMMFFKPE